MKKEFEAMIANKACELIPRSSIDNVINCIWLFKVKEKDDGSMK